MPKQPYHNHPICQEIRNLMATGNIGTSELASRCAMSKGNVSQYRLGYRLPQPHLMDTFRQAILEIQEERNGQERAGESSSPLSEPEANHYARIRKLKVEIFRVAEQHDWKVFGIHDRTYSEVGLLLCRDIIVFCSLRPNSHEASEEAKNYEKALGAANVHVELWHPNNWPAIERILALPPLALPDDEEDDFDY